MANVTVRKEQESRPATQPTEWEPARLMKSFLGWDPFRQMAPFAPTEAFAFNPDFEVKETKDGYLFKADVPGVRQEDIDISMTGSRLTISGKREAEKEDKSDTYYTFERSYGSFTRSFTMPDGIDANAIHAELREGVLTLHVPKKPEAQPKKIAIKPTTSKA